MIAYQPAPAVAAIERGAATPTRFAGWLEICEEACDGR